MPSKEKKMRQTDSFCACPRESVQCSVYTTMIVESRSRRSFNHQSICAVRHILSLKTVLLNAALVKFRILVSFCNTHEHRRLTFARYVSLVYSTIVKNEFFFSISTLLSTHIFTFHRVPFVGRSIGVYNTRVKSSHKNGFPKAMCSFVSQSYYCRLSF